MSSLGEVQRIIGLSLSKIQMGRNQRGGLPLHKNLLVATVLNKARDVYMQETMYMNYRLMACGQFGQEDHEDMDDEETPDAEDYEEDSESDVEDDNEPSSSKDYVKEFVHPNGVTSVTQVLPGMPMPSTSAIDNKEKMEMAPLEVSLPSRVPVTPEPETESGCAITNDEGFIDESDCDCDARNFSEDGENRVPFQYCFNCAPFHPSNGRGPTLVSPQQQSTSSCVLPPTSPETEDKLIYDMDSKSTRKKSEEVLPCAVKRKRNISEEETEDAINSILPKRRRDASSEDQVDSIAPLDRTLDDSGYGENDEVFHPAFRGSVPNGGMEVDQITSLVSIFSFGQQLFSTGSEPALPQTVQESSPASISSKTAKDADDDSDSDSDTSSDSGHSSGNDKGNNSDENDEEIDLAELSVPETRCSSEVSKEKDLDVSTSTSVAAAV